MKGVIDIEFMISVIVFLSMISFVSLIIIGNIPLFRSEAFSDDLRARAYEISQLLLFDKGEPSNWETKTPEQFNNGEVKRLGLSDGQSYVISDAKISKLDDFCLFNYTKVKELLGQDFRNEIKIDITTSSATLAACRPLFFSTSRPEFQITRFATLPDKSIVKIVVSVI